MRGQLPARKSSRPSRDQIRFAADRREPIDFRSDRLRARDRGADGSHDAHQPTDRSSRDHAANAAIQLAQAAAPQNPDAAGATETKGETVEQRITTFHAAQKITPDQESLWNAVAQAMRENTAAVVDKIVAENRTSPPQNMAAVDDLKMYQKFAQAHVDGLANLIAFFAKFYDAMPDAQKKIADEVFITPVAGALHRSFTPIRNGNGRHRCRPLPSTQR